MAKFLGLVDLAIERMSLQQLRTELNSSDSRLSFLLDKGIKLSFKVLTTSLSAICTQCGIVVRIYSFRQFLPWLKPWASLAMGV